MLESHLKSISAQQWSEKQALYYSAKRYEELAKSLSMNFKKLRSEQSSWKKFYKDWSKSVQEAQKPVLSILQNSQVTGVNGVAYPDEIATLRDAVGQLTTHGREFDSAVKQKRSLATDLPVVQSFARLKQMSARLSARGKIDNSNQ
jgi:hypothetical protein